MRNYFIHDIEFTDEEVEQGKTVRNEFKEKYGEAWRKELYREDDHIRYEFLLDNVVRDHYLTIQEEVVAAISGHCYDGMYSGGASCPTYYGLETDKDRLELIHCWADCYGGSLTEQQALWVMQELRS